MTSTNNVGQMFGELSSEVQIRKKKKKKKQIKKGFFFCGKNRYIFICTKKWWYRKIIYTCFEGSPDCGRSTQWKADIHSDIFDVKLPYPSLYFFLNRFIHLWFSTYMIYLQFLGDVNLCSKLHVRGLEKALIQTTILSRWFPK